MAVHFGFTQHMSDIIPWLVIDGDEVNSDGPIMERTRMKYNSSIVIKKQSAFADCSVCRQKGIRNILILNRVKNWFSFMFFHVSFRVSIQKIIWKIRNDSIQLHPFEHAYLFFIVDGPCKYLHPVLLDSHLQVRTQNRLLWIQK
jgi:hypothetical protein